MRVLWWKTMVCVMKVKKAIGAFEVRWGPGFGRGPLHHQPIWIFLKDLSKSISVGTRKMVNFA